MAVFGGGSPKSPKVLSPKVLIAKLEDDVTTAASSPAKALRAGAAAGKASSQQGGFVRSSRSEPDVRLGC